MNRPKQALFALGVLFLDLAPIGYAQPQAEVPASSRWGVNDERGNGNTQGVETRLRCASYLAQPTARVYELGRVVSSTMPQNPFGDAPVALQYLATRGIPFTQHAGNGEVFSGGIGSQGTQFPFTDPVPTPLPPDTLPDLPFSVHHNNLTQHGIYQIQNLVLDEMARDRVSLSCAIVLPLRILGGAGSMVRPIAVGTPRR